MSHGQVWVALLASSPFSAVVLWAVWWLISDALRERRRDRAAARFAAQYERKRDERGERGQVSAA